MTECIEAMIAELESLLEDVQKGTALLDAYLYESRIRCGRPNCRCMSSEYRHSRWCLSYLQSGKSHTRTVREEALPEVRALCEHYRVLRNRRKQLLARVEQIVAALDRQIEMRTAVGWDWFDGMKAGERHSVGSSAAKEDQ